MRGLPFSLVCAHLQTETQGLRDQADLNLDNMVRQSLVRKVNLWRAAVEGNRKKIKK